MTRRRRLWQGNYWDHLLRHPDEQIGIARYIVLNPIRSGLVTDLRDYRWWGIGSIEQGRGLGLVFVNGLPLLATCGPGQQHCHLKLLEPLSGVDFCPG